MKKRFNAKKIIAVIMVTLLSYISTVLILEPKVSLLGINKLLIALNFKWYGDAKGCENPWSSAENFVVVVARYKEDLAWVAEQFPCEKVVVYNKGETEPEGLGSNVLVKRLPNLGRESDTYLKYIIENYENLPKRILFLQGDPFDHSHIFMPLSRYKIPMNLLKQNIIAPTAVGYLSTLAPFLEKENLQKTKWAKSRISDKSFKEFARYYITDSKSFFVVWGGQFAVEREDIRKRSRDYYIMLDALLDDVAPIEGHYLERLWDNVFSDQQIIAEMPKVASD
jgi:hypothetical protein